MYDKKSQDGIREAQKAWEKKIGPSLAKRPELKPDFVNTSGIPIERVYLPTHLEGLEYLKDLGLPGEYPFTRGVQPTMYRGRHWTMRQYAGFGSAEDTNRRYRYLIEQGQTGLSVAFDLPTQIGYDSDHPASVGEVGKVGVAIDSVHDMRTLFDRIPLDRASTSMTINAPAALLLALYIAVGDEQQVPKDKLNGTTQNDILKEYTSRGTYIFPPEPSMRIITDIFAYCSKEVPNWNTISISGYHMREAGCTAVQEVAFTLANGIAYVEAGIRAGLDVDAFGPRLAFFFCCHLDFLEEVAKFRAARRLWARIMRERFGAKNPRSLMLRFHTQTAGCTLTAQQPMNNVVRVTFQALAAVLGGTQSLHTNSMDEALALPTQEAVQLALRTQQLIAHESGVTDTVDPLGGSFYVEQLTREIEERALEYIRKIDDLGGSPRAIEQGFIQKEIQEAAYRYQQEIEAGDRVVVGINRFQSEEPTPIELHQVDPAVQERQVEKLKTIRSKRDSARWEGAMAVLRAAAKGDENLMPPIVEAVKAEATLGEICDALREVFGEYEASVVF